MAHFSLANNWPRCRPTKGFKILAENWSKIPVVEARQQMLKAWNFGPRKHPRLLDVLDLGMRDPSPEVRQWAQLILRDIALRDFAEAPSAYPAWYEANRGKSTDQISAESIRELAAELDLAKEAEALKKMQISPNFRALGGSPRFARLQSTPAW